MCNVAIIDSSALARDSINSQTASSGISRYAEYLKNRYERSLVCDDNKFPPIPSKKYVNLAVVDHTPRDLHEVMKYTLKGSLKEIPTKKEKVDIEDILKPIKKEKPEEEKPLSLVLIEGPPGVGKSTVQKVG